MGDIRLEWGEQLEGRLALLQRMAGEDGLDKVIGRALALLDFCLVKKGQGCQIVVRQPGGAEYEVTV